MLNVSGVCHTRAMCYGEQHDNPQRPDTQMGWTRCEEMRPQKRGTMHDARRWDRVRGMSNHMCLNMDPGGKIGCLLLDDERD